MALYDDMLKIADKDKLAADHPLRLKAIELKNILEAAELPEPKRLLGAWARARKVYCEYTETPLVDSAVIETGAKLIGFLRGEYNKNE